LAKTKRVFEIAKELGVNSKDIVAKCKAEGVPGVTNHMSTVKVGLAATINEWFGDEAGGTATAVETAEKVDLPKVRAKARRKAKKKGDDKAAEPKAPAETENEPSEAETLLAEPAEVPVPVAEADAIVEPTAVPAEPAAQPQAKTPEPSQTPEGPEAPETPAIPPTPAEPEKPVGGPVGKPNIPDRPKNVKPVGEVLAKPSSAQLKGPKVIRVEKADPIPAAPARRSGPPRSGGGGAGPGSGGFDPDAPGITRSRGPARGRGAGGGGPEDGRDGRDTSRKRRYQSTRRGRSADAIPLARGAMSEQDLIELDARLKGAPGFLKQRRRSIKSGGSHQAAMPAVVGGKVEIQEPITIKAFSAATGIKGADVIKWLFSKGVMATINSAIEADAAMEIALEYDIELEVKEQQTATQVIEQEFEQRDPVDVRRRPPVVTVLGHVDHGKTSLLDKIRTEDVAAHEAGGITQHVGAYRVTIKGTDQVDKTVVFLDTPGHEAFTSMRARGAKMTDLVVLVVAADDGVMPQTIESINHAKAAEVPIIVALNKIDTPHATEDNIRKIYGQLAEHGLNPVEWGGDTEIIKTSAIDGTGVSDLMEVLDYQAELLDLTADYGGPARGAVIEGEMQAGRGSVARVLVQEGELKVGDFIVIGRAFGRVREMTDDRDRGIKVAGPATPVELSGIDEIPDAGGKFYVTESLQRAENVAKYRRDQERSKQLANQTKVTLDNFAEKLTAGTTQELRVVLKADVQGSLDVLRKSLTEQGNIEVAVKVIHSAVGGVTESDILLADASDAIIIGFHVIASPTVREIADQRKIEIRLYRVIYDLIDEIRMGLEGMLAPESRETELGSAEVREVFRVSKVGNVAGCLVTDGVVKRGAKMRIVRDGGVVTENRELVSLRRVKDDVREVRIGTECGIQIAGFDDVKPGDILVCYNVESVKRKLG
jgi:translation initiation factor IF-2